MPKKVCQCCSGNHIVYRLYRTPNFHIAPIDFWCNPGEPLEICSVCACTALAANIVHNLMRINRKDLKGTTKR